MCSGHVLLTISALLVSVKAIVSVIFIGMFRCYRNIWTRAWPKDEKQSSALALRRFMTTRRDVQQRHGADLLDIRGALF
jgi:hypothetical protein